MRFVTQAFVILLLTIAALPAEAQPEARVVARLAGAARYGTTPIQAKLGQTVELTVKLQRGRHLVDLPAGSTVQWLRVTPRMQHELPTERTQGERIYSNGTMFGPNHGRWLGLDQIEYETTPLAKRADLVFDGDRLRIDRADPAKHGGRGTIWIAAAVTLPDGRLVRTPDGSSVDHLGLSRAVLRLGFRRDDSYLGWLGTYFNVPYVFGSTAPQTDNYLGTDCADALVGARRAQGHRRLSYTSVTGIGNLAKATSEVLFRGADGVVRTPDGTEHDLRWGVDIEPGDLLAMDFTNDPDGALPRAWDHLAVLVADGGDGSAPDGVLDENDVVRHMTTRGLVDAPFRSLGQIRFRMWRWR